MPTLIILMALLFSELLYSNRFSKTEETARKKKQLYLFHVDW
jgi:hypothetical protein